MKDKLIIVDLDDTLISTHFRQYSCIRDYLTSRGISFIDYDAYFGLRRANHFSNTALLESLGVDLDRDDFKSYYLSNIESEKYLALDTLIVNKELLAGAIHKGFTLFLLSLRSHHENSRKQLLDLGIADFFTRIYFEQHQPHANPKLTRLKHLKEAYQIEAFCGDSVSDHEAAELLNINFVQVKSSLYMQDDFKKATAFNDINQYLASIP